VRSVTGLCILVGSTIGGFVPDLWHAGMLSLSGVVFGLAGGIAGLWVGVRLNDSL
jgi:predicted MFS family arabinose efflux permease